MILPPSCGRLGALKPPSVDIIQCCGPPSDRISFYIRQCGLMRLLERTYSTPKATTGPAAAAESSGALGLFVSRRLVSSASKDSAIGIGFLPLDSSPLPLPPPMSAAPAGYGSDDVLCMLRRALGAGWCSPVHRRRRWLPACQRADAGWEAHIGATNAQPWRGLEGAGRIVLHVLESAGRRVSSPKRATDSSYS